MAPVIVVADWVAKRVLGLFGVDITRSWAEEEAEEGEERPTSRGELFRRMGDTLRAADLTDERREEVLNALAIGSRTVEEIMVDRDDVVALSTTDDFETNLERMAESPHVRFPLVGEDLADFHGVVYTPELLRQVDESGGNVDLREVAAPPMTTSADAAVSDLIDRFQAENQELALVLDGGEVVGLVTTTDAFEAIAGDLKDPMDVRADRSP